MLLGIRMAMELEEQEKLKEKERERKRAEKAEVSWRRNKGERPPPIAPPRGSIKPCLQT